MDAQGRPSDGADLRRRPRMRASRRLALVHAVLLRAARVTDVVEPEIIGLRTVVRPGDVCLDIGAKHGLYTAVLADSVGPDGRVVAVEPLPGPRRVLRGARSLLGAHTVTVVAAAAGDVSGPSTIALPMRAGIPVPGRAFLTSGATGLGSNTEFAHHRWLATTVVRIDDLVAEHDLARVDVIKIDVEGAEAAVIAGATTSIGRWSPTLLVEVEARHLARYATDGALAAHAILDGLAARGYRAFTWDGRHWEPTATIHPDRRNHLFVARPDVLARIDRTVVPPT